MSIPPTSECPTLRWLGPSPSGKVAAISEPLDPREAERLALEADLFGGSAAAPAPVEPVELIWGGGAPLPSATDLEVELFPETAAFPVAVPPAVTRAEVTPFAVPPTVTPVPVTPFAASPPLTPVASPAVDPRDAWVQASDTVHGYDDWGGPVRRTGAPIPIPHRRRGALVAALAGAAALVLVSGAGATVFLRESPDTAGPGVQVERTSATAPPRAATPVTAASTTTTTTTLEPAPEPTPTTAAAPRRATAVVEPEPVVTDPAPPDVPADEPPTTTTSSTTTSTTTTTTTGPP